MWEVSCDDLVVPSNICHFSQQRSHISTNTLIFDNIAVDKELSPEGGSKYIVNECILLVRPAQYVFDSRDQVDSSAFDNFYKPIFRIVLSSKCALDVEKSRYPFSWLVLTFLARQATKLLIASAISNASKIGS